MHAETETRWIVLGTDGRHVSLGRTELSETEVKTASDALAAQGLSAWLARMQGEYYSRGKVMLERLRRIGAAHDADWQGALMEFQTTRHWAIEKPKSFLGLIRANHSGCVGAVLKRAVQAAYSEARSVSPSKTKPSLAIRPSPKRASKLAIASA